MPRDLGNLIFPAVAAASPKGSVSPVEGEAARSSATMLGFLVGAATRSAFGLFWPDSDYASWSPWIAGPIAFALVLALGYLHYRSRGGPADAD
jgi:hypothetical protein